MNAPFHPATQADVEKMFPLPEDDDSPRKELTISAQLASVDEQRATLLHAAAIRRAECLTELAELCHICGPLTRDDIPEGVLRRRRTKKPTRAPRAKKKTEEASNAGA